MQLVLSESAESRSRAPAMTETEELRDPVREAMLELIRLRYMKLNDQMALYAAANPPAPR